MYVITGATGNTGSLIANRLLDAGKKVRVVGRSKEKLQPFVARGAEAFTGDVADADAMIRAFDGAQAVYAMIPPSMTGDYRATQEKASDALAAAVAKAGVKHVVALSSVGADKPEGTGPIAGLHNLEEKLNAIANLNALYLRPTYFMENFLEMIPVIKQMGTLAAGNRDDLPMGMIATRDIGARAADELLKLTFTGHSTRELLGPREYTFSEAAGILGKAIGKPGMGYMQAPLMMVEQALMQMGMSKQMAQLLNEMTRAMNDGTVAPREPRSAENTTPATLEQFADEVFAPAFHGKAVSA